MAAPIEIRKPRMNDRPLFDVMLGLYGYPAVLVANRLRLFDLLAEKAFTLEEICAAKGIARRPAEALLSVCSVGLMSFRDGRYSLTPQGPFGDPTGAFASWHAEQAVNFTRGMHSTSMAPALAWPKAIDLSIHRTMLDVGAGSGAHSIGAVKGWPELRAIVFDQPDICKRSPLNFAENFGLTGRISVRPGDFFEDQFPPADLPFYGMIFHDWPPDRCRLLAQKSFAGLPTGGRIIVHELLFK